MRVLIMIMALIALAGCAEPMPMHNPTPGTHIDTPPHIPTELTPLTPPTLPHGTLGAWTPEQPLHLDVAGRVYAVVPGLVSQNGRMFIQLDDGTRLWVSMDAVGLEG